ncbi:MAG: proline racemase, partial [Actinobacteria bacterium 13_2_20CM_2_71_6]
VRRLLCHEPRGHADMYGCFLVPPDDDGADFGAVFWHNDGYSTACGHGTIALGVWAVESGRVTAEPDGEHTGDAPGAGMVTETVVTVDVPSGRVTARVRCRDSLVEMVTFRNVPSYVLARAVPVPTSSGTVEVDVAYGGAVYASVAAQAFGLTVVPESYAELITAGREVKRALDGADVARHPSDERLSGVYGTILYDDLGDLPDGPHQRNVTVFADGEVDRSPCGSGTSARLALLAADGRLDGGPGGRAPHGHSGPGGRVLRHDSIVGTTFIARVVARTTSEGRDAVVSEVDGTAFRTGEHRFTLDPRDQLGTGFVLR